MKTRDELLAELKQLAEAYEWLDRYAVEFLWPEAEEAVKRVLVKCEEIRNYT